MSVTWTDFIERLPLVAILRGLRPDEAVAIGEALAGAGFLCAEVPLNSPSPFESISTLARVFEGRMLIGAGTVLTIEDVARVRDAGARFIVSPNTNPAVIGEAKRLGLKAMPGFFTATEAFAALDAGADALKLFPADQAGPAYFAALRAVLPPQAPVLAVGGVDEQNMATLRAAGAKGFGFGGALYRPGAEAAGVAAHAKRLVDAFTRTIPS